MAETLLSIVRQVGQYNTKAPITLIRQFAKNRFDQILDRRIWSFQLGTGIWNVAPCITSNVSVTFMSNIVTFPVGVLPSSASQIAGWQMVFNGQTPYYNVVDRPSATTLTLDRAFAEPSNSSIQAITQMVYFMSERPDFEKMRSIIDRSNNWQLRWNVSIQEMNNDDPQRSTVSPPTRGVALGFNDQYLAALPNGVVDFYGQTNKSRSQPWFETWPRGAIVQPYPYYYRRRTPTIQDGDPLPGFLRGYVLYKGALADLCSWAGTASMPNPVYNPVSAATHERYFEDQVLEMEFRDEQATQTTLQWLAGGQNYGYPEFESARFFQSHAPAGLVLDGGGAWGTY